MSRDPLDPLVKATVILNRIVTTGHAQRSHPFPSPIVIVPFSKEAVQLCSLCQCVKGLLYPLAVLMWWRTNFFHDDITYITVWQEEQEFVGMNCGGSPLASPFPCFLQQVRIMVTKNRIDPQRQTTSVLGDKDGRVPMEWLQYSVFLPIMTYFSNFQELHYWFEGGFWLKNKFRSD